MCCSISFSRAEKSLLDRTCGSDPCKNLQNGAPNPPKSSPNGAKRGQGRPKKQKKNIDLTEKMEDATGFPHSEGNCGQHGSKLSKLLNHSTVWIAGETAEVAWGVYANHGG